MIEGFNVDTWYDVDTWFSVDTWFNVDTSCSRGSIRILRTQWFNFLICSPVATHTFCEFRVYI